MEIKWHNRTLVRMGITMAVFTALILTALGFYSYTSTKNFLDGELARQNRMLRERLVNNLAGPLSRGDMEGIESIINAELADERLSSIILKNGNQTVIFGRQRSASGAIQSIGGAAPRGSLVGKEMVISGNTLLANVELYVRPDFISGQLRSSVLGLSLLAAGLIGLVFLILFLGVRKSLVLPMKELTRATESISLGRLENAIVNRSKNELGHLTASIERLRVSMHMAIKRLAAARKAPSGVDAPEWRDIILEKKKYGFEFFALRILVGRLTVDYRNNPTPETMRRCIEQLVSFFQNEKNPQAQKDLHKIFGGVAI